MKSRNILYIMVTIICVVAIVIAVYYQIFENGETTNIITNNVGNTQVSNPDEIDLKKIKNVHEIKYQKNILSITFKKGKNNLANLLEYLKEEKIKYLNIYSSTVTLNDVFLELTGKELRD